MFSFVQNLFHSSVTDSIDEFANTVRSQRHSEIEVRPSLVGKRPFLFIPGGVSMIFTPTLKFTATSPRGRKAVYREQSPECLLLSDNDKHEAIVKILLLGEQRVKELHRKLFGVAVQLLGPYGPMDKSLLAELHQEAEVLGVSI